MKISKTLTVLLILWETSVHACVRAYVPGVRACVSACVRACVCVCPIPWEFVMKKCLYNSRI